MWMATMYPFDCTTCARLESAVQFCHHVDRQVGDGLPFRPQGAGDRKARLIHQAHHDEPSATPVAPHDSSPGAACPS